MVSLEINRWDAIDFFKITNKIYFYTFVINAIGRQIKIKKVI